MHGDRRPIPAAPSVEVGVLGVVTLSVGGGRGGTLTLAEGRILAALVVDAPNVRAGSS